ncbi:uncharacterized protein LOC131025144 [Salvia miltiorrhiza]|uniref:uncharacterized protein LOC131025144 n=1 Tax=Salvia miltiorrhiza TaxID=226208 RepID=UPI0025ABE4EE|nr:uncharacterized protein LOC131025144 [Salvia miltiorrhiza]XP_057810750.1 uncharacterized protein LOC131025144 [Salvia miltiorrhiza]
MDGENGRRLNTNANVSDNRGEKLTPPFSIVNSERSSISSKTEGERKQGGNGSSPAKISVSPRNAPNVRVEASCRSEKPIVTDSPGSYARDPFVLTESPAIQVMERPKTSDPNTVPTDSPNRWSVDSNDSLFSIHMGNDSFSKDRSLSISGDIGELSLSEAYLPRASPKSGELHQSAETYTSPAAAAAAAAAAKALEEARKVAKEEAKTVECDPPEASISIHSDSNLSRSNDTDPPHEDDKGGRNETFVPPSTSASGCPMGQCLCCGRMSSCCRLPSCSCCHWFRWPSCSSFCISCPSCCSKCRGSTSLCSCCCYSWNRETKRVRSVTSYALMDRSVASSSKHKV